MANRFLNNIRINDAYTFPASDGNDGQVITTDGAGNLAFENISPDAASVIYRDNFTGDGSTATFDLQNSITDEDQTQIYIDGVYQEKSTYSISGTTITFTTAPISGHSVEVISISSINTGPTVLYQDNFTGNGNDTAFTLGQEIDNEIKTFIFLNGVYQFKNTYTVDGTTLTFDTAPANGVAIEVVSIASAVQSDSLEAGAVIIPVKNTHTASIAKGTPVYITGNVGASERLQIAPADASNSAKMPAAGLLLTTLAVNAEGYVITGGYLRNITTDTIDGTSTSSNDTVYVKAGGGLTMTKPTGSNLIQNIAKIARSASGNSGSLIVSSILRTNDIPNLNTGKIWVGDSNTVESTVIHLDESNNRLGINNNSPNYSLDVTGDANISSNVIIGGNLTVDGTQTILNTQTVEVEDNILQLNTTQGSPDTATATTSGISVYRGNGVTQASFIFDDADDTWDLTNNLNVSGKILVGTGATAAASLNAYTQTVSTNLYSALRIIENSTASSYWDIGATGGSSTLLNFYHNGATTPKISFTHTGGATFAGNATIETGINLESGVLVIKNATGDSSGLRIFQDSSDASKIYNNYDGTLQLGVGNTTALTIDGSENVGIGTTSPGTFYPGNHNLVVGDGNADSAITVYANPSNTSYLLFADGTSGSSSYTAQVRYNHSTNHMEFATNNSTTAKMTLDDSGNVGIATTNPQVPLQIGTHLTTAPTDTGLCVSNRKSIRINDSDGSYNFGVYIKQNYSGSSYLILGTRHNGTDTDGLIVKNGNVGIGTGGYAQKPLDISGATGGQVLITGADDTVGTTAGILFRAEGGEANGLARIKGGIFFERIAGSFGNGDLKFAVNTSANNDAVTVADTKMTINSSGNVGIGTTSPTSGMKLDVQGGDFRVGDDANQGFEAGWSAGGGVVFIQGYNRGTSSFLDMSINNTVRITSGGNVGIGTTSPSAKLEIEDSGADLLDLTRTSIGTYRLAISTSDKFSIYDVGAASDRLVIDSSGKVGIGTTSPNAKLYVNGDFFATSSFSSYIADGLYNSNARPSKIFTPSGQEILFGYFDNGAGGYFPRIGFKQDYDSVNSPLTTAAKTSLGLEADGRMSFKVGASNSIEALTIKADGKVGIATTSPSEKLTVDGNLKVLKGDDARIYINDVGDSSTILLRSDGSNTSIGTDSNHDLQVHTNGSERMRIDNSGRVCIDDVINSSTKFNIYNNNSSLTYALGIESTQYAGTHAWFRGSAGTTGTISYSGTSTSYNTSSDYRLKENVVEMTGALDRVNQLKPSRFNFIADADTTVDGFLAHEVSDIVPEAITGTKDEVDEEGNPIYQGIDQSKLVPLLVGAIKELKAEIETLKLQING